VRAAVPELHREVALRAQPPLHSVLSRTLITAAALSGGAYGLLFLTHASAF